MKMPSPPDPKETAATQSGLNRDTAITQYLLNATNQTTPYGTLTYKQTGNVFHPSENGQTYWVSPEGKYQTSAPGMVGGTTKKVPVYREGKNGQQILQGYRDETTPGSVPEGWKQVKGYYDPQFTATTKLSKDQQKLLDLSEALGINIGGLLNKQATKLGDLLDKPFQLPDSKKPFTLNNEATESRLMELGRKRLDPELAQRRTSTEQDLFNRGVRPGTEAYDRAMLGVSQGENDAYNQLLLTGRQQAVNELLTQHNVRNQDYMTQREAPIQEILQLAGLSSGPQNPQFINTPGTQLPNVDYTGLVNQQYQAKLANAQAGMSGMFGLGSALIGAIPWSDRRLKTDIRRVGTTFNGLSVYTFRYKGDPMIHMGLMADEVLDTVPEAVCTDPLSGFYKVDYERATEAA